MKAIRLEKSQGSSFTLVFVNVPSTNLAKQSIWLNQTQILTLAIFCCLSSSTARKLVQ